ncbi:hypothetical protein FB45DRAFT_1119904 [Roridomyces roridus]|uniref:Uncharacterized protein n=1 Tax=Roridomyces roridus TaxID=1738132 RepID=A0AAD7B666_9AGAR|nr:hypothetical protein FB45DRAFT_1119904 [Roridomyces roridus]
MAGYPPSHSSPPITDDSDYSDVEMTQPVDDDGPPRRDRKVTTGNYSRRLPSQALVAEQREIPAATDATRQRDQSFSLRGTTLCPIQKLPLELLHAVFIACLPLDKDWRRAALGLPALWASLALECSYSTLRGQCEYLSSTYKNWLSRVGRHPLSLWLRTRGLSLGQNLWDRVGFEYTSFLTIEGVMHRCTTLDFGIHILATEFHTLMKQAFVLVSASFSSVTPVEECDREHEPIEVERLQMLNLTTSRGTSASLLAWLVLPALRTLHLKDRHPSAVTWAAVAALAQRSSEVAGTNSFQLAEFSHTRSYSNPDSDSVSPDISNANTFSALVSSPAMQNLQRLALRETVPLVPSSHVVAEDFNLSAPALAPFARPGTLPKLRELVLERCVAPDGVLSDVMRTRMQGFLDHPEEEEEEEETVEGRCVRLKKLEVAFPSLSGFEGLVRTYERDRGMLSALAEQVGFELVITPVVEE